MPKSRPVGHIRYDNADRVVVVTGGCSGIGRAICEQFLASGAVVVCCDIDKESARSLSPEITFQQCDTSIEENCQVAVERTIERFGGIDVLVNNAAIQPPETYHPLHELSTDVWRRLLGINFSGYTYMAKCSLKQMVQQQSGVIVNIASAQGHRTAREVGVYGPIKAGNIMQARQWGIEYARQGIRVVSVSPGAIDTPLARACIEEQGGASELINRHPVGRLGNPAEIAYAVMWLSSSDAAFITATDLEVDGGLGAFAAFADPYPLP